jgi:hypothetical protein
MKPVLLPSCEAALTGGAEEAAHGESGEQGAKWSVNLIIARTISDSELGKTIANRACGATAGCSAKNLKFLKPRALRQALRGKVYGSDMQVFRLRIPGVNLAPCEP